MKVILFLLTLRRNRLASLLGFLVLEKGVPFYLFRVDFALVASILLHACVASIPMYLLTTIKFPKWVISN